MKKLLLILCITMNLICMMLAVFLFMVSKNGVTALVIAGQSFKPMVIAVVMILLAILFAYLATKLAVGKK